MKFNLAYYSTGKYVFAIQFCFLLLPAFAQQMAGIVDTTFNVADTGEHYQYFGQGGITRNSHIYSNGDILTVGEFTSFNGVATNNIAKYNESLIIDQAFHSNIGSGANGSITHLLVLSNGSIFLAGEFSSFNGYPTNGTILLNSNGTIDLSYNITTITNVGYFHDIEEHQDKIIVVGVDNFGVAFLVRIEFDGTLDPSFTLPTLNTSGANLYGIEIDQQDKIYLNGFFQSIDGHATTHIARLHSNGSVDTSFTNVSGEFISNRAFAVTESNQLIFCTGPVIDPVIRLNYDGTVDASFNLVFGYNSQPRAVVPLSNGDCFILGQRNIYKVDSTGTEIGSFSRYISKNSGSEQYDLDFFPNGDILLTRNDELVRLNDDGVRLAPFQKHSMGPIREIMEVRALPDGKSLIAGKFYGFNGESVYGIARIQADGQLDPTFSTGNIFSWGRYSSSQPFYLNDFEVQSDGKILVAGQTSGIQGISPWYSRLIRLFPDGTLDPSFNSAGFGGVSGGPIIDVIMLENDKFLAFTEDYLRRFNSDGTLDLSFTSHFYQGGEIEAVHLLESGKIMVGGSFSSISGNAVNGIAMLGPNGSFDPSFSSLSGNTNITAIDQQSNGKIILVNALGNYSWNGMHFVYRVTQDGQFDSTFVTDSIGSIYQNGDQFLHVDDNDKVWLFGDYGITGNIDGLIRLDTNGLLDTITQHFPENIANEYLCADVLPNGNILLGGKFFTYGGVGKTNLTRIFGDSTSNCVSLQGQFEYITPLSCQNIAEAKAHAVNGTPPYTYSWDSQGWVDDDTLHVMNTAGLHDVSMIDSNACIHHAAFWVNEPTQLTVDNDVTLVTNSFVPGESTNMWVNARNTGCVQSNGDVILVIDPALSFNYALPAPNVVVGDTLIWNFTGLHHDSASFTPLLNVTTDSNVQPGDSISFHVVIDSTFDYWTANNNRNYTYPIHLGAEALDKQVYPGGECTPNYIASNDRLIYTVRFQNVGNGSVMNVRLDDSLSSGVDLNTLNILASSHDMYTLVRDQEILEFRMDDVMLPDSSTNGPGSVGYVIFEIDQNGSNTQGFAITNKADVYFDINPPVSTNEVLNTVNDNALGGIVVTETILACDSLLWNGNYYNTSGIYTAQLQNSYGCDSVITLDLTIEQMPVSIVTQMGSTLTTTSSGVNYQWLDCDSGFAEIINEISQTYTPVVLAGNFAVEVSTTACVDTSDCYVYDVNTLEENELRYSIHPNPAHNVLYIHGENALQKEGVQITDMNGRTVYYSSEQFITEIDISNINVGIYFITINSESRLEVHKFNKE